MVANFIGTARRLLGLSRVPDHHDILPADRLRKALERERARSHRLGDPFSLLAFTFPDPAARDAGAPHLFRVLAARLRTTDEVGWLSDLEAGAILSGTPGPGAWTVARDVLAQLPQGQPRPSVTVYCYPGDDTALPGPGGADAGASSAPSDPVEPLRALFVKPLPRWKRGLDVLGAGTALVLLSPLLLLVCVAIKLGSRGPVLFRQRRSGLGGRPFTMFKFRSMVVDAEARQKELLARNEQDGPAFKIKDDPRITTLGKFLRVSSIDELPQLWNVLVGDMSLVGPRPLPCHESEGCQSWQRRRLDVTPGLTCIWQVFGRSRVSFVEWVRMDIQYIRSLSPLQDLRLLFLTLPAVLFRRGAR